MLVKSEEEIGEYKEKSFRVSKLLFLSF